MASLDVLCSNPLNLKNKIMKTEHKKIFCGSSKILKNISWPINMCLKYFMIPTNTLRNPPPPPSYILNIRSLSVISTLISINCEGDVISMRQSKFSLDDFRSLC